MIVTVVQLIKCNQFGRKYCYTTSISQKNCRYLAVHHAILHQMNFITVCLLGFPKLASLKPSIFQQVCTVSSAGQIAMTYIQSNLSITSTSISMKNVSNDRLFPALNNVLWHHLVCEPPCMIPSLAMLDYLRMLFNLELAEQIAYRPSLVEIVFAEWNKNELMPYLVWTQWSLWDTRAYHSQYQNIVTIKKWLQIKFKSNLWIGFNVRIAFNIGVRFRGR